MQDVAYSVNKIKFGSREKQKVAIKYCYTTSYYKQVCHEIWYSSLSDSSLLRILHGIKISQRRDLVGFDDVTAADMNAFSVLSNVSENMNDEDIVKAIEKEELEKLLSSKMCFRTIISSPFNEFCTF